jgi:AcrR family transcriptional regulator
MMRRAKYPMREKKKAESRARLIRAAQHLFSTQGYENTTLEEVADRAGLHVQTLYRHFANKQDLAMAGPSENVDRFRQAIRAADRDVDTFAFWRNWLLGALDAAGDPALSALRRQGEMLRSQAMLASNWLLHMQYQDLLTESLAEDFQMDAKGIGYPRLVAGMLTAGHIHVLRRYIDRETDVRAEARRVVDMVEADYRNLVIKSYPARSAAQ